MLNASTRALIRQLLAFIALYSLQYLSIASTAVLDFDIGWHIRTGQWIFEHDNIPTVDPFSVYGHDKPWVAYSWLFELIVYSLRPLHEPSQSQL